MSTYFQNIDLSSFWEDSDYARKEYVCPPVTSGRVKEIETVLGYKLPGSYVELMKTQNGGHPVNRAMPCKEPTSWARDHIAITGLFGIGNEKTWSLCGGLGSQFMIDEWGYPDIGVYICDCPSAGHDMVALDYTECGEKGEPCVVHVDQESDYKTTFLASGFPEFVVSLVHEYQFDFD